MENNSEEGIGDGSRSGSRKGYKHTEIDSLKAKDDRRDKTSS